MVAKRLDELVSETGSEVQGNRETRVSNIAYHSRKVTPGTLFVAMEGAKTSGRNFVDDAVARGAVAVAAADISGIHAGHVALVQTNDPHALLTVAANRLYDYPGRSIRLIGVTGTNGKTTTTYIIRGILEAAGEHSGLIGTIRHYDGREWIKAVNTTPESLDVIQLLANLREMKIRYCVMEVSSHAIALGRIASLEFSVGTFTNFSHDHLDFHGSMEEYKNVKLQFFRDLKADVWAVYNVDDPVGAEVKAATRAKTLGYGMWRESTESIPPLSGAPGSDQGTVRARLSSLTDRSTVFDLSIDGIEERFTTTLIGRHNVYNIMAAAGVAHCLGLPLAAVHQGLAQLKFVAGRMKRVENPKNLSVFVDYAHSPDALEHLIQTAREILDARKALNPDVPHRVIVVFGCGGNRDRDKRPVMGRIASELADLTILTSDNPRDEDPYDIIDDIKAGIEKDNYEVQPNRFNAIRRALFLARTGDIVLIAGKGHEDYQIVGSERKHFDDEETVKAVLR